LEIQKPKYIKHGKIIHTNTGFGPTFSDDGINMV